MSNQSLPKHLRMKALRATHAVTLSALMLTGCPDDKTTSTPPSWTTDKDQSADQTDMVTDLGTDQGADMVKDMPKADQGTDLGTDQGSDMTTTDMTTEDMVKDMPQADQGADLGSDMTEDMVKDMNQGPKCDVTPDNTCPNTCTADDDADCCIAKSDRQQVCAIDAATSKCECKPIVNCSDTPDNICPSQCNELNDADCCTDKAPDANAMCTYQPGSCSCAVGCSLKAPDNVCPAACTPQKDADCCVKDPLCNFDANSMQCFCAVPGPFRPPVMPAR